MRNENNITLAFILIRYVNAPKLAHHWHHSVNLWSTLPLNITLPMPWPDCPPAEPYRQIGTCTWGLHWMSAFEHNRHVQIDDLGYRYVRVVLSRDASNINAQAIKIRIQKKICDYAATIDSMALLDHGRIWLMADRATEIKYSQQIIQCIQVYIIQHNVHKSVHYLT